MEHHVREIYADFDTKRKRLEAQQADVDDLKLLEDIEKRILNQSNDEQE